MDNANTTELPNFFEENMEALQHERNELYNIMKQHSPKNIGCIIPTQTVPTLRFNSSKEEPLFAYGMTDPWKDVEEYLGIVKEQDDQRVCVFVGMGLGYGPLLVINKRPMIPKIVIMEPCLDLFYVALQWVDLRSLILSKKVSFIVGDPDWDLFQQAVIHYCSKGSYFLLHAFSIFWAPELYDNIKNNAEILLFRISSALKTSLTFGPRFFHNRFQNLTLLRHLHWVDDLRDLFKNKPAVLVSAGPSLDQSLPMLKTVMGKCVIIAVDTALSPLIHAGIYPDFVTSADQSDVNFEKVSAFLNQEWPFSFVSNFTVLPKFPKCFPANRLFFLFEDKDYAMDSFRDIFGVKTIIESGSSVVHLSLNLALIIGADPIVLVGHDFAHTSSATDHATNVVIPRSAQQKNDIWTTDIHGRKIKTTYYYLEAKSFLEEIITKHQKVIFNATAAGACIKGTTAVELNEVLERFCIESFSVTRIVDNVLNRKKPLKIDGFLEVCRKILIDIDQHLLKVNNTLNQLQNVHVAIVENQDKFNIAQDTASLPSQVIKEAEELLRLNELSKLLPEEKLWYKISELLNMKYNDYSKYFFEDESQYSDNTFTSQFKKELNHVECLNQINKDSLNTYKQHLDNLVFHLTREDKLLRQKETKGQNLQNMLSLANLYLQSEDLHLAKLLFEEILSQWPDSSEAQFQMGAVQIGLFNYETAFDFWADAQKKDPGVNDRAAAICNREALNWFEKIRRANKPDKAYSIFFKRIIKLVGGKAWVLKQFDEKWKLLYPDIEKQLSDGDIAAVEHVFSFWEEVADILPEWHVVKAMCLAARSDFKSAILHMQKAVQVRPHIAEWLALLSRYLFITARLEEGIEHLQKAVKINPETALLWEELGDTFSDNNDYASAVEAYKQLIVALPERTEVLRKMGDCYMFNKQLLEARSTYKVILKRNPNHSVARDRLREIH